MPTPGRSVHVVVHRRADKLIGAAVQRIVDVVQGEAVVDVSAAAPPEVRSWE